MKKLEPVLDKDGDGKVSGKEKLQGVVDGVFNPVDKPYAQELLSYIKEYYSTKSKTATSRAPRTRRNGTTENRGSITRAAGIIPIS